MYEHYLEKLIALLAEEYNCTAEQIKGGERENVLTRSRLSMCGRRYSSEPHFFHMVTLGANAVVTANEALHPFLSEYVRDKNGYFLFEIKNLRPIERELNTHGYALSDTYHMFLPKHGAQVEPMLEQARRSVQALSIRRLDEAELPPFYCEARIENALTEKPDPNRPDRVAFAADSGGELIAIAGCSEDAPGWMQIGVDVFEGFRGRGVGKLLVALLRNDIEERGDVPFYGTGVSNYRSWSTALACGFRPAWLEIGAVRLR